jgi:TatD DNase family protein
MNVLIDTHCHLYVSEFDSDRQQVLQRAQREGVLQFYLPAINSHSTKELLLVEENNKTMCFAMMGLHPCYVKENYLQELQWVKSWLEKRLFKAVGEIGLDFYWDKRFTEQQYEAFDQQIEWAKQYNLPIAIHTRNAMQECIDVVRKHYKNGLTGVFHCFGGTVEEAQQIIEMGFYMGIGGVLTYKNSGLQKVVAEISLQHFVLETDAPYLAPVPYRGKRNESAYLKEIAQKLAEVKQVSFEEVAATTTANAQKLFGS